MQNCAVFSREIDYFKRVADKLQSTRLFNQESENSAVKNGADCLFKATKNVAHPVLEA